MNSYDHNFETAQKHIYSSKSKKDGLTLIRERVNSLLESEEIQTMLPVEHYEWAKTLPRSSEVRDVPDELQPAASRAVESTPEELHTFRNTALVRWCEKKLEWEQSWQETFKQLPEHVQSVLGPKKNLILFKEMLLSAGSPDAESLIRELSAGFPLTGELPRSGTLVQVPYEECAESAESLRYYASVRNQKMLNKVRRTRSFSSSRLIPRPPFYVISIIIAIIPF